MTGGGRARAAAALVALPGLLTVLPGRVPAAEDGCGPGPEVRHRLEAASAHHRVVFVPQPAPLASGRHFGLDITICPRAGASLPLALRVDADMPAHRHGMNYRPTVRALGDGRYRADGLLLHMPGRWRFSFEISADGRLDRLGREVDVE